MNMANRAFWTCEETFGKIWGLQHMVVHWIYTMVITHVLVYNLKVWWPRFRNSVSRTEFSKLQRLACLAKTGVMKMTPKAAMKVLLGLLPLHMMTEAEAKEGFYRLMCTLHWRPKSTNFGHTKKSWDMEHKPILHMWSERMLLRYAYQKPFTVKFPEKCK